MSSKVYGCGERLLLLKASTVKNKGRLFWRCRNWATNSHCNYFEWVDDKESDFQGKETESEASGGKRVDGGKKRWRRLSFFEKGENYAGFDEEK
ncbi:hypothetical protein DEO72_LG3g598 [Vigna unguiculata]|uniref:GRF-type domain-containing protein n=1 Tax=Vigna unguiculata TaxID=3917 RepID=A0A4D6LBZ8_VIGUN|nr:hypothetical protein DEO72_LG3g598 [Vigna unguiculata]